MIFCCDPCIRNSYSYSALIIAYQSLIIVESLTSAVDNKQELVEINSILSIFSYNAAPIS